MLRKGPRQRKAGPAFREVAVADLQNARAESTPLRPPRVRKEWARVGILRDGRPIFKQTAVLVALDTPASSRWAPVVDLNRPTTG